jgi:hypothetical protein
MSILVVKHVLREATFGKKWPYQTGDLLKEA